MSRVNIVKRIKSDGRWKMLSIPRNPKGNYDWNALPGGRYYVEWYIGGTRRRESAGVTTAQALEAQRRKRHELEGRKLGVPGFETAGEATKKQPLHVAITKYLEQIDTLKKPNTHRKYEAVLNRFGEFFRDITSIDAISGDDLTRFVVALKRDHKLGANTVLHNAVIVAQFLKRHGRGGITRELQLPERITSLPKEYREEDLGRFFEASYDAERVLFSTFLLTGFREQEVMYLFWSDINLQLQTVRVTAKPELGFYPKRCEERQIPAAAELPVRISLAYRKSGAAHARSLQSHRQACRPRSRKVRSKDLSFHLRDPYAPTGLRRSHGATLDGTQVARNDNALSGASDRCSRQVGSGKDPHDGEDEPGAPKSFGTRDRFPPKRTAFTVACWGGIRCVRSEERLMTASEASVP